MKEDIIVPSEMEAIGILRAARKYVLREMLDGWSEAWDTLFKAAWEIWMDHKRKPY